MPTITVTAAFKNITPDPKAVLHFQWNVSLVFTGLGCPHSLSRVVRHTPISLVTTTNSFKVPFTAIRGGNLTVTLTVQVGTVRLTSTTQNFQVMGANPGVAALAAYAAPNVAFRKLIRVESRLRQFLSPAWPYFSEDNYGGVGICQITNPAPTDDEVWSWKANVDAGWRLFQEKEAAARAYPRKVKQSEAFHTLTKNYNDLRYTKAKQIAMAGAAAVGGTPIGAPREVQRKDLALTLPDYTDEQLQLDTIRGFNGYADGLHEYRVRTDQDGVLVVKVDEPSLKGVAEWERISAADRIAQYDADTLPIKRRGDPAYVDDVLAMPGF